MMSFDDVARADRNYEFFFGDLWKLMQNAGSRVAEFISRSYGAGRKILVVAGSGNNGGDGIVAGSFLMQNNDVVLYAVAGVQGMKTREARQAIRQYRGRFTDSAGFRDELRTAHIVIDAIFGSGFSGDPRPPYDTVISEINASQAHVVSVDVPSALGSRLAVRPEATVTFTDVKEGMNTDNSGQIVVADIGIPGKVFTHNGPGEFVYYRKARGSSHKGMNGRVAVVGGWTFHGSAVIAARGAMTVGTDLVKVYTTSRNYELIGSYDPGIIVRNVDDGIERGELASNDAILIGSGLGRGQNLNDIIKEVTGFSGILVLDAEGLDFIEEIRVVAPKAGIILTPHAKEFARISGTEASEANARAYAEKTGAALILKGQVDVVCAPGITRYTEGGNARMTMGGTGDLLAGLTAGIAARSANAFRAACMASFLNKSAGDFCMHQKSYWYTVSDMISAVPEIMRTYLG